MRGELRETTRRIIIKFLIQRAGFPSNSHAWVRAPFLQPGVNTLQSCVCLRSSPPNICFKCAGSRMREALLRPMAPSICHLSDFGQIAWPLLAFIVLFAKWGNNSTYFTGQTLWEADEKMHGKPLSLSAVYAYDDNLPKHIMSHKAGCLASSPPFCF